MNKILIYCGLNHGYSFRKIVKNFDLAIGFEPIPHLYKKIKKEFESNDHIKIINAALAEKNGTTKFHIHDNDAASSIGELGDEWRKLRNKEIRPIEVIEVPTINLEDFFRSNKISHIDTLITDVQGYDYVILKTVESYIRNKQIRCITCEVERDRFPQSYKGIPSNKEKDFKELMSDNYCLVKRVGEKDSIFHDLTWIRKQEENRIIYLYHDHERNTLARIGRKVKYLMNKLKTLLNNS